MSVGILMAKTYSGHQLNFFLPFLSKLSVFMVSQVMEQRTAECSIPCIFLKKLWSQIIKLNRLFKSFRCKNNSREKYHLLWTNTWYVFLIAVENLILNEAATFTKQMDNYMHRAIKRHLVLNITFIFS